MSDPIQSIARHLGIQTFGDGLLAKIGQTIDLLQEAARNRADLAAECERLREETAVLVGEIAEIEVRRDAALAELAALKGGREAVAWAVCREHGKVDALIAAYASESAAKAHVNSYATKGCSGLHVTPLYTAPPAQASAWPEGWKLVPVEPTHEMEVAGCEGYMRADGNFIMHNSSMGHAYAAMLAAAPTPGASDGKGGGV